MKTEPAKPGQGKGRSFRQGRLRFVETDRFTCHGWIPREQKQRNTMAGKERMAVRIDAECIEKGEKGWWNRAVHEATILAWLIFWRNHARIHRNFMTMRIVSFHNPSIRRRVAVATRFSAGLAFGARLSLVVVVLSMMDMEARHVA